MTVTDYQVTVQMLMRHPHFIEGDYGWIDMEDHLFEYEQMLLSGLFWELFPEYTGEWVKDKEQFIEFKKKYHGHL